MGGPVGVQDVGFVEVGDEGTDHAEDLDEGEEGCGGGGEGHDEDVVMMWDWGRCSTQWVGLDGVNWGRKVVMKSSIEGMLLDQADRLRI